MDLLNIDFNINTTQPIGVCILLGGPWALGRWFLVYFSSSNGCFGGLPILIPLGLQVPPQKVSGPSWHPLQTPSLKVLGALGYTTFSVPPISCDLRFLSDVRFFLLRAAAKPKPRASQIKIRARVKYKRRVLCTPAPPKRVVFWTLLMIFHPITTLWVVGETE